jgi:Domain of unknown function (DUF3472).
MRNIKGKFLGRWAAMLSAFCLLALMIGCTPESPPLDPPSEGPAAEPTEEPKPLYNWSTILELPDAIPAEDNPENRMAHNIYCNPDLSGTSGRYTGFLIDFCTDHDAVGTYWSLCNWRMDTSELASRYQVTQSGGAYAGLQNRPDGKKAIMSFWEHHYIDENGEEVVLRAPRVYPPTDDTNVFGGEGNGTNYIPDFEWKADRWYRMYLCCYEDEESGHTYVEQWVEDIEAGAWTKISCFDTGLKDSCFTGGMSQFMENYISAYCTEIRTCAFRNIYVREKESGEWVGIRRAKLSIDTIWDNKKGVYAFSADENTLYGITCGTGPDTAQLGEDISSWYEVALTDEPHTPGEGLVQGE